MTERARQVSMWEGAIVRRATVDAFTKLDPRVQVRNPVMCLVTVGSVLTTMVFVQDLAGGTGKALFTGQVALWLWFTVLFANFAEAMAEGRGKAQAATLRKTRTETVAHRLDASGRLDDVAASSLRKGDRVRVWAGEFIPADGEIVEGVASVDESAITGESAPVIRESGGDRSAVTGGTRVLSDVIVVQVTADPGHTFLDRMIALVEGAQRQKTPNELALGILLAVLSIVFLLVVVTLEPFARYAGTSIPIPVLVALLVCLIPTTIGALISAIGIAGMDRLVQHNVLAMSGRAVEAAGDVDTLLLDKTGTITLGNRQAAEFLPVAGVEERALAEAAQLASLADETPEGRSIVVLAKERFGLRARALEPHEATFVPFTAQTRMSGVDLPNRRLRKGAAEAIATYVREHGGSVPAELAALVERVSRSGGTPLVVADDTRPLGVIYLKDIVKGGMRQRFDALRAMGIRTVMITGDNPVTAEAIAKEAGVDDFLAEAKPEDKMALIKREQAAGKLVAMTGDGTNDAPALAQADVGVAMNSGTTAAKEAGNMVDLDSNPTKLIEIVEIGKQLLMTRGALTTFSISNDVAKYFAIIPAMFLLAFPQLQALNVMRLATPESAILSAVIFNALIIIALIPLALRGVSYTPLGAAAVLRRNLLIYGVGGVIVPFMGIKAIDVVLVALGLA
jgi:K+-transporting ATPase ATPase B chain